MKRYIITGILALSFMAGMAQDAIRSAYFLEGYTYRHNLNPAFAGERNYISMPVLGNLNLGLQSNVGLDNFLYPTANGELTTFMNSSVAADDFLGGLTDNNKINLNLDLTILSAGFRGFHGYNTIEIGVRNNFGFNLPKDLFTFMKLGMDGPDTRYNFKDMEVYATSLAEVALGHSHKINDRLTIGAKVKVLLGLANANAKINNMDVQLSDKRWAITADGEVNISAGDGLYVPTKQEAGVEYDDPDQADLIEWDEIDYDKFGLAGFGLGFDLGATYKLTDDIELSAAVLDLGFVNWDNSVKGACSNVEWEFDGFQNVTFDEDQPGYEDNKLESQWDRISEDLEDCVNFHKEEGVYSRSTSLATTVSLGGEYTLPTYRNLRFGLLATQRINGAFSWTEGRLSANVSPVKWFEANVNCALSTFGTSFGWVVNFHPRGFNFFIGTDHQFFKVTPQYVPVGKANANINFGMNITFG